MPGASRITVDKAEGIIIGPGASSVLVNGKAVSVANDDVTPHGSGLHAAPKVLIGSDTVFAEGKAIIREGDKATCLHVATGSSDVLVG